MARVAKLGMAALFGVVCSACDQPAVLTADMPLHLEQHLEDATVIGANVPDDAPVVRRWQFDQPQGDWRAVLPWNPTNDAAELTRLDDALRVTLTERTRNPAGGPRGGLVLDVPDVSYEDLAYIIIRARTSDYFRAVGVGFNRHEGTGSPADNPYPFEYQGDVAPVVTDGTVQSYRLRLDNFGGRPLPEEPFRQIGLWFSSNDPASIDILSIEIVPKVANYFEAGFAAGTENRGRTYRQSIYVHTPGRLQYRVYVPDGARLDFGMGVLRADEPVTFRVTVIEGARSDEPTVVHEEPYADKEAWGQRSVSLAEFAGHTVTLGLEADALDPGTVALWGAPTVTGAAAPTKPNVIFYVIDGGGADQMSLYGYNRRTTPHLEALAREGAVFEWAHSNSDWSKPSTTSFMTSLQNSVLGNTGASGGRFDPLPVEARTMAERFHAAGYPTAVLTSNPWAGSFASLERGVDHFRDAGVAVNSRSSEELQREFWEWRETYRGAPYWVHFQTTDVHAPHTPQPPFAGLFAPVGTEQRIARADSLADAWGEANPTRIEPGPRAWVDWYDSVGVGRVQYYDARRALYDEAMAHQDYELGRFVERLKQSGEWENTLLVIAADHSIEAADRPDFLWFGGERAALSARHVILRTSVSRVPLMFVWPGHIAGGQRLRERVSMIDVLPTVLELAGLPQPEVLQGQSLAPLLLGRPGWEPRPVIFDQFETDFETGKLSGQVEIIDGRWGASLPINAADDASELVLFDIDEDPMALRAVNDDHPDLVAKYTDLLTRQWEAHQLLAKRFTPGGAIELTAEQLQTLRTLGYIR